MGGPEPEGTELTMVPAEAVEEVTIIGVADEVSQDRGLEMQVRAEVDSEVKEVA